MEMGWTCGATKRLEVVYPSFVLGAAESGIVTSRAARGQIGGQFKSIRPGSEF